MIIIIHNNKRVIEVKNDSKKLEKFSESFGEALFQLANEFPKEILVWVHEEFISIVNFTEIEGGFNAIAKTNVPKTNFICQSKVLK